MRTTTQFIAEALREIGRRLVPGAALLLAACATPVPPTPAAPPAQFKENALWQHAAATRAPAVPDDWWRLFGDPELDALQVRLVIGNESLKAAAAQVTNARALVQASQSAMWPTLSVAAGATRSGGNASSGASVSNSNNFSLLANASWETDLWGRLSKAADAAQSSLQASRDDLAAARLSAQAALAQAYIAMRAAEAQRTLLERSVADNQRSLELTQARYAAGVVSQADVQLALTQLRNTQAQVREFVIQRAQLEHGIAVLLGVPPATLSITQTGVLPALPQVPELLPATLLERRPDIAAAERRVASAYLQIGVADAAFFPSLTLSASGGYRSSGLSQLVSAPTALWSIGLGLAEAVLDSGQHRLASDQARAAADAATSSYRQTVLTALQEVEDNLIALEQLDGELLLQREALAAAQRTLEITQEQYKAGTVSYLNIVISQLAVQNAAANVVSVHGRELAATNVLLKNIGGRWQAP